MSGKFDLKLINKFWNQNYLKISFSKVKLRKPKKSSLTHNQNKEKKILQI